MASSSPNDSSNNGNDSSSSNSHELPQSSDPELAQVFAELVRGEKTAQALETHLTSLEKKIDDLLASVEQSPARQGVEKAGQGVLDGPEKS